MEVKMHLRLHVVRVASVLIVCVILFRAADGAPLMQVDFGQTNGNPVQPGFTELSGDTSQSTASATIGAYTVQLAGEGFEDSSADISNIDPSVQALFRDTYYNNSDVNGDGINLSIGGVTPNKTYSLELWSYDAAQVFSPTDTTWSPYGNTTGGAGDITNFATPYPQSLSDRTATIQVTSSTNTLDIFGTTLSGEGGTRLNGFVLKDGATSVMSVDLGRPAVPDAPSQTGFAPMNGLHYQASATQAVGSYTVSVAGEGFENTADSNANAIDASVRNLFRGAVYNNSSTTGDGVALTIAGVVPNKDYDVKLWSYDGGQFFSSTSTLWSATGDTSGTNGSVTNFATPRPTTLDDYSTTIRVHSTSNVLHIFGTTTAGDGGTRLDAVELDPVGSLLSGDVNNDGIVNGLDINLVATNWLHNEPGVAGDANGDGIVNGLDINAIATNWLKTAGGGAGAAVPEPSTLGLALVGSVVLLGHRSRARRRQSTTR
jgi:hypothetical protein